MVSRVTSQYIYHELENSTIVVFVSFVVLVNELMLDSKQIIECVDKRFLDVSC